ncbi:uncharacterized protein LOC126779783 [Nymphalis io]|uniref:uncharacterized protein LOC126779783 n=1 Tax=Inachis io TaxID=171585 RepID=UPI00216813B7|nr:uncharacterized protein LOC126779783 [Nymphalis io]
MRKEDRKHKRNRDERKINSIEEENIHYIFNVNDDATIECTLGGIKLRFLIDSGCKLNIITDKTWKMLKQKRVNISNYTKRSDKILYPYGSKTPLGVKWTLQTTLETNGQSVRAVIYVVNGGSRDLLGKETAISLGLLRLGTEVHEIKQTRKPFPKFKDVFVEIPVDETCKPVSQPYRRIPIPIEKKVEQKIQELLDSDIIEEVHGP